MKNKKLILLIFIYSFFSIGRVVSQDIYVKITYKKKSTKTLEKLVKQEKPNKTKELSTKIHNESIKEANNFEYSLIFDNKSSLFNEIPKMDLDKKRSMGNSIGRGLAKLSGDTHGIFFTDRLSGKTIRQREFEAEMFLIEHDKIEDWALTQEKRKIGNYICYKATKNDSYINASGKKKTYTVTSWYTQELPYPYGPTTYNGLPGVILELNNHQTVIYASKIELNPKKREDIIKPNKGTDITKEEFDNMMTGSATGFSKRINRN